jgi:hypothetical protein
MTRLRTARLWFAIIPCLIADHTLFDRNAAAGFDEPIRPFLESYCLRCHDGEKTEGGANLSRLIGERDLLEQRDLWLAAAEQVTREDMPPKGAMPEPSERAAFSAWIENTLRGIDVSKYRSPGQVPLARLTKAEYRNTLRDLLGVDLHAGEDLLPDDAEGSSGFTNDRTALSLSPDQLDGYLTSAERAVAGVIALSRAPEPKTWEAEAMERSPAKLAARGDGVILVHPDHELKTDHEFPVDGWYDFRLQASVLGKPCVADLRIDGEVVASVRIESELTSQAVAAGFVRAGRHAVTIQSRNLVPGTPLPPDINRIVDDRARESAPRLGPLPGESEDARKKREDLNEKAWGMQECFEWLRALGPGGDPRQIDLRRVYLAERRANWERLRDQVAAEIGLTPGEIERRWRAENEERLADNEKLLAAVAGVKWEDWERWQGKLFVDRLAISGPVRPGNSREGWSLAAALSGEPEAGIRELLRRAFRRPVSEAEAARYAAMPVEAAVTAILCSPRFLFRDEMPPSGGEKAWDLDDFAMASRLSYFLWQSMPDDELFDLAAAGLLRDPKTLAAQADRMLDDPRADAFFEAFAFDWLGIRELGRSVSPDPARFPEFSAQLAAAMREEAARTIAATFRGDRPLIELIDSPTAYLNEVLARHYGVSGVEGEEFRPVTLPDARRGGLLGMGSVLVATSSLARTNPVRRGAWVLERLLGEDPGEALPTAGELPGDAGEARGKTLREELDLHRTRADCARCHDRIDPIGFGLENYDATGRWRDTEAGRPVDASGQLPDGRVFAGPAELKQLLREERRAEFEETVARRLLAFALGRELRFFDEPVVGELRRHVTAKALVRAVVASDPFRRQALVSEP